MGARVVPATFTRLCQGCARIRATLAERDYLQAIRERVVVFDGGMGATLEMFDLTAEDYGGLQGKCHEALVLNRPDVIQGVHESMLDAGAEVVETDTFQASRLKLEEWGLAEHTLEINRSAAEIARAAAGEHRFVAGSIGPTGHLPASDDPTLGKIRFGELVEIFTEQAGGLVAGRRRPADHRDRAGHPRGQGRRLRRPRRVQADRRAVPIQCSVSLLPNGGKMLLGTDIQAVLTTLTALDVQVIGLNCSTGPEDMRDAIRYLGENSPLPVHCIPNAGLPLQGPEGETIFPEQPDPLADVAAGVRRALRRRHRRRLLRHDARPHPRDRRARRRAQGRRAPGRRGDPFVSSMMTATALVQEPRPTLVGERVNSQGSRKAKELLLGRRLRRPRHGRRGPGHRRRARARRLRRADRAPGRGRADARGRQAHLAVPAGADPGRLDRARRDQGRAGADPRPRDRQLDQPRGRPRQGRHRDPARGRARRGADRADDRRGRHGQDRRAQGRDRQAHPRDRLRRARARPAAADLRRAHLHPHHRRRRVEAERGRDDRGHPRRSRRSCRA